MTFNRRFAESAEQLDAVADELVEVLADLLTQGGSTRDGRAPNTAEPKESSSMGAKSK